MTNMPKVVTLPSEAAQALAAHIASTDLYDIGDYDCDWSYQRYFVVDNDKLAKFIQEYWDRLP